ncbi:MAG: archaeosortase/exosortase family protein, partial [Acidobacteriota bacterium]|nr:archaeosortase/exosortase family protein [Acidobacteriota bacterium]
MAGSLALFGALRLPWTEAVLLLPLTRAQGLLAERLFGAPSLPVQVTLECSGAEVLALCAGAVLAYPVRWRARLAGAAVGIGLILLLNTLRIGTLGLVVASPVWFNRLHLFLWPTLLTLVVAGYVFTWMALADRSARKVSSTRAAFPVLAAVFLIAFAVASPWYLESPGVLALGGVIATAAAALLSGVGMSAYAVSNVLVTSRGAFIVTQECVTTPLIPIYLAAVGAYAVNWRWLVAGVLAAAPLFTALGIARLLVVALPAAVVASPTFLVHAFYQLLLGAVVVVG